MEPSPNSGFTFSYMTSLKCCIIFHKFISARFWKFFLYFLNSQQSAGDQVTCPVDRGILIQNRVSEFRFCWLYGLKDR